MRASEGAVDKAVQWRIDPAHTVAEFAVRHMMISTVKGQFGSVEGVIEANPDDPSTAAVDVEIDAASLDTRETQRDQHLRSGDFFDVERYPKLTFRSRSVESAGGDAYRMTGDLTIRDVTRPVTLDFSFTGRGKDPWGNERIAFTADASIDRREFGLTWNTALETGGFLVGDEVKIHLDVQAVRQA